MPSVLKELLKKGRASQPFNYLATSAVRGMLGAAGVHSELVIKHLHRVGTVRSRLPNGRELLLWSRGDDWVSNQVYWRGWQGYEPETAPRFYRLASQSAVTLDVGAHVGFYALLAGHANPAGRVFAFEPLPPVFERLQQQVRRNRLANVTCVATAVGEADGTAEFYHVPAGLPLSSSLSREFMSQGAPVCSTTVPVIALDRFLREQGVDRVDLLKLDTETTEVQVLNGMAETLRRDRPDLVCEVLPRPGVAEPLEALLGPLGYRYYHLTPSGPVLRRRLEGHPDWMNYLFTTLGPDEIPRR
jgi:FkbM family methyltransferase